MRDFLVSDLNEIAEKSEASHENLRNANILILGPNGFIGNWLRSSIMHLNKLFNLNIRITGIVRKPRDAVSDTAALYQEITLESWNEANDTETFTHIFHCATNSRGLNDRGTKEGDELLNLTFNTINKVSRYSVPNFVHLSSGAVYGELARRKRIIRITSPTESISNLDLYGQTKLKIENLVKEATEKGQIRGGNPRLFSFFGPGLSLDKEFAISSFVKSAINGSSIKITGNPGTERTYMYPTDLVPALLACAVAPSLNPIHIGGSKKYSMSEIADEVARNWHVNVEMPNEVVTEPNYYNPEVSDNCDAVSLSDGLSRWKSWMESN